MKKTNRQIQDDLIKQYKITIEPNSKCYGRTHVHIKKRTICKWKQTNSIVSTFTLLHEIGHCENNNSKMRRCEEEYNATQWALDKCVELNIDVPLKIIQKYQRYIYNELARGLRRNGSGYPSKEEMQLRYKMPTRTLL
ncbi:MAG: hypothetical protein IKV94_02795 [Clostridia bacterium]|nr:hypothetical protein [Clostridia bacterium]MBR6517130.1 hypothetical protein [Bacilli bacterium]